ncbi:hypothetical protein D9M70_600140 [compost metagenome]
MPFSAVKRPGGLVGTSRVQVHDVGLQVYFGSADGLVVRHLCLVPQGGMEAMSVHPFDVVKIIGE